VDKIPNYKLYPRKCTRKMRSRDNKSECLVDMPTKIKRVEHLNLLDLLIAWDRTKLASTDRSTTPLPFRYKFVSLH
jgi:hypothetical protein